MDYSHTQKGMLHLSLYFLGAIMLGSAWLMRRELPLMLILLGTALLMAFLAESFRHLTVEGEGDGLLVRYGPLPLFRKRIAYSDIVSVEQGRTTLLDGWGIHYLPGRGWIYNMWGFDCVKLTLRNKVIRVGSDDAENLARFLRGKIGQSSEALSEKT